MTRRRFHALPSAFNDQTVTLGADEARHLRDVLRLQAGDEVLLVLDVGIEERVTERFTDRSGAAIQ